MRSSFFLLLLFPSPSGRPDIELQFRKSFTSKKKKKKGPLFFIRTHYISEGLFSIKGHAKKKSEDVSKRRDGHSPHSYSLTKVSVRRVRASMHRGELHLRVCVGGRRVET